MQQPRTMNGRNFFLTAVEDVITLYFRISVFAGVFRISMRYEGVPKNSALCQKVQFKFATRFNR